MYSLEYHRLRARADYAIWKQEQFEQKMASLIFRIGRYNRPLKHKVTIQEVKETIRELTGVEFSDHEIVEWMHKQMMRK